MQTLLTLIVALPLLSAIVTAVLGPKVLKNFSHWPTILALGGSFVCSFLLLLEVRQQVATGLSAESVGWETTFDLWTWADVKEAQRVENTPLDFNIAISLRVDPLTSIMLAMVTFISTLVAIYASGYMHGDRSYWRFFSYVSVFVFSMTMLVSVSNFVLLYVFWEAVGVCSYLLIGFWYEKPEAAAAGKKAFLVNRVGDFGFALALFLIWTTYGTLNFHDAGGVAGVLGQSRLSSMDYVGGGVGLSICLLLLVGACGKSAQFPLHVWLPDAMEGPTPVSALIHAATMVTAGVYMVTRCTPLYSITSNVLHADPTHEAQLVVACIGAFTALLAGLIAITQNDLKRVLAYSTISQLGYMFLALGTGSLVGIVAGMFHLFTHAFFKALLFLGAGSVMHAMGGVIDMRRFSGLRRLMPWTCVTFLFGCLALSGVWPFAGFWSKDAIVAAVHEQAHHDSTFGILYYVALFTAFLTAMYTFRAFFLSFFGDETIPKEAGHHAHESPMPMVAPLAILALFAAVIGFAHGGFADLLVHTPSLAIEPLSGGLAHLHEFHGEIAAISTVVAFTGIALAAFLFLGDRKEAAWLAQSYLLRPFHMLSSGKFFIDQIYNLLVVWPLLMLAKIAYFLDRYLVDGLVDFCGYVPVAAGRFLRTMQSGLIHYYASFMVLGFLVMMGVILLRTMFL